MTPPLHEHDDRRCAENQALILYRLDQLEDAVKVLRDLLDRFEKSLVAYRAVWKFAILVASGVGVLAGLVIKFFGK